MQAKLIGLAVSILAGCSSPVCIAAAPGHSGRVVTDPLAERQEYRKIMKIKDPEKRIISEQRLSVLGLKGNAESYRTSALDALRKEIASNPSATRYFEISFERGLSIGDVAKIIASMEFNTVNTLELRFVETPLVETVGFRGFDDYRGSPLRVIEFLVYRYRETLREQVMIEKRIGRVDHRDVLTLARLEDFSKLRFYGMNVQTSLRQIGHLLDRHLQDIMMIYSLAPVVRPRHDLHPKPLPTFNIKKKLSPY